MSSGLVGNTLGRLRHPWLFALAATALAVDLVVPDALPFVDEILLAAATTGLAMLRKRRADRAEHADTADRADGPERPERPERPDSAES